MPVPPPNYLSESEYNKQIRHVVGTLFNTAISGYGWNLHRIAGECGLWPGTVYRIFDVYHDPKATLRLMTTTLLKLAHGIGYRVEIIDNETILKIKLVPSEYSHGKKFRSRRPKPAPKVNV